MSKRKLEEDNDNIKYKNGPTHTCPLDVDQRELKKLLKNCVELDQDNGLVKINFGTKNVDDQDVNFHMLGLPGNKNMESYLDSYGRGNEFMVFANDKVILRIFIKYVKKNDPLRLQFETAMDATSQNYKMFEISYLPFVPNINFSSDVTRKRFTNDFAKKIFGMVFSLLRCYYSIAINENDSYVIVRDNGGILFTHGNLFKEVFNFKDSGEGFSYGTLKNILIGSGVRLCGSEDDDDKHKDKKSKKRREE